MYLESIYTQWKANSAALDPKWDDFFAAVESGKAAGSPPLLGKALKEAAFVAKLGVTASQGIAVVESGANVAGLQNLVRAYQTRGHEAANLDPLGRHEWRSFHANKFGKTDDVPELEPSYHGLTDMGASMDTSSMPGMFKPGATLSEVVNTLKTVYCGTLGIEYMHIGDLEKLNWIRTRVEDPSFMRPSNEKLMEIFKDLAAVETFEQFLNNKYKTTKRFGIDGGEATVTGVNFAIGKAVELGASEAVIGMPHRGRLNVLTNILGKPLVQMFAEFKDTHYEIDRVMQELEGEDWSSAGDVKYHLGTSNVKVYAGKDTTVTLEANPSHLETVNTVTLGRARAKQFYLGNTKETRSRIMPILFHGDASFAGQGVVYETMQLAHVDEFDVGGTIHVIVNNQVGFTTDPKDDRSTLYCSDLGKAFNAPIMHCNADDPVAVVKAFELAAEWRQTWNSDVIVDVVCYRRFGHNETDNPEYTQPQFYKVIAKHPRTESIFCQKLLASSVATQAQLDEYKDQLWKSHEEAFEAASSYKEQPITWVATKWEGIAKPTDEAVSADTGIDAALLKKIGLRVCEVPDGFKIHRGLVKQLKKKKEDVEGGQTIDWATAEAMAFGSLLLEGKPVRITGQDVQRGTFAHRHCVIKDQVTGDDHCFLNSLDLGPQNKFTARNSILSEYGVLGFELGFSYENPYQLNIWEAQFGDFANTAQVMIDQFISAGEHKWLTQSGIVLLLPHGYYGQGAEHSSCRLERFLQMTDDDEDDIPSFSQENFSKQQSQKANWVVTNISTPSNYFHALRRQLCRNFRKPLVVASPKSLFRLKQCVSPMADMSTGTRFLRLIPERNPDIKPEGVDRLVFCSGKIYYELEQEREKLGLKNVAIVTLEQLAPFPFDKVEEQLKLYPKVDIGDGVHPGNIVWCQEEPKNMGPWSYVRPRFVTCAREGLDQDMVMRYVGRRAAASPATGFHKLHVAEQEAVIAEALVGHDDESWAVQRPSKILGHQT